MSAVTNTLSFITSNKGCDLVIKNNFVYKMNKKTSSKIYWICKTKDCSASIHTDLDKNLLKSNERHNHLLEPEHLQVHKFRNILKERAINETVPIQKIFDEELSKAQFSSDVLSNIPLVHRISKNPINKFPLILIYPSSSCTEPCTTRINTSTPNMLHIRDTRNISNSGKWREISILRHFARSEKAFVTFRQSNTIGNII